MLAKLKERLTAAKAAVAAAEDHIVEVAERSPERLAVKHLDATKAELADAEHAVKLAELQELQAQLTQLLVQKTAVQQRIKRQLEALLPDVCELDGVEVRGGNLPSRIYAAQMESRQPMTARWRDPKPSGVSMLLKTWLQRLES